jgi:membrane protein DedA with SNARE-associated domain
MDKRFFYVQKFLFSRSSPFGHFGLLRSCGAIARLSHVGSRTKPPDKRVEAQPRKGNVQRLKSLRCATWLERGFIMSIFDANLIQDLIANYGYTAVFAVVLLESSGIPLPGETILVCASVYAGTQPGLDIRVIIGVAACGVILGDNIGYWVGRSFGRTLLLKYGSYFGIDAQKLALGEYLFMRYGGVIVFFGRFVALLRVYAALLAGVNRLKPADFVIYNAAGGLIWASTFGIGGYFLGRNLQHLLGPIGWVALAAFAVGSYFIWSFFKSNEKRFIADAQRAIATRGVSPSRREINR